MTNLGFSWGFEPKFEESSQQADSSSAPLLKYGKADTLARSKKNTSLNLSSINSATANKKLKRKVRSDEDMEFNARHIHIHQDNKFSRRPIIEHRSAGVQKNSHKKVRNQNNLVARQLPIFRSIELLDKKQLVSMLLNLVDEKPELNQVIYNSMNSEKYQSVTKPTVEKSIKYLEAYLQEKILDKLPYKVDPEAEYSYLRVQKSLIEFYTILSDFILNYLPPVEKSFMNCLRFIDSATNLVHRIPFFKITKFNMYHYTNIYEQLSHAWWNILKNFLITGDNESLSVTPGENDINVFHMLEFNLVEKLNNHKQQCQCDKFDKLVEFVEIKLSSYYLNGNSVSRTEDISRNYSINSSNGQTYGNFKNNCFDSFASEYLSANNLDQSLPGIELANNAGHAENSSQPQIVGANFSSNNNPINHKSYNSAIMDSTLR